MSSEAAAEFARLADEHVRLTGTVIDLRQDVASGLEAVTLSHQRDVGQILASLKVIKEKPALAVSSGDVEVAAGKGASKGSAAAVADLNRASETMAQAVEEIQASERKRRQVSSRAKVATTALLALVPALVAFGAGLMVAPALQRQGWLPLTGIPVEQISLVRWALQFQDYDKRALAEWAVSDDGKWAKRFADENTFIHKGDCPDKDTRQNRVSCRVWQVR